MSLYSDSEQLDAYLPVYDAIPEKLEDIRPFLVEMLKNITLSLNVKEIGFFLDEELLTGKSFIPGINNLTTGSTSQTFRSILRKVVDVGPITSGTVTVAHGIVVDFNYEQIELWACATNSSSPFTSTVFGNSDTIRVVGPNIIITSDGTYDRCKAYLEYTQEQ